MMFIQAAALFLLILTISTTIIYGAIIQDINPCLGKLTCKECIQTKGCAFCAEDRDFGDGPRCFKPELHSNSEPKCREEFTINPDIKIEIIGNQELTRHRGGVSAGGGNYISGASYEYGSQSISGSYRGQYDSSYDSRYRGSGMFSGKEQVVQISPQSMNVKLRLNQEARFQIRYAQAVDYPVDLYYLMDLSKSMEDDKEKLSKLGDLLSETMRNITSNFKLGFGSFVDKVLMPYVSTVPKKLIHPCDGCEAPYGFRNHMPLNTDTRTFSEEVKKAAVSGNLDAPEGGFDAIMQAIVCRDIGWREQARHLLVFSTDAGFHYAGDGKLGGVITPNDGQCHLDSRGYYTHSTIQDYPSISQINHKVKNSSINIIFAVTKQQIEIYEKLVEHIEGSSCAVLSSDSSNVVDIVREEYSKISSSVEMKTNIASENIKATFYSSCLSGGPLVPTNKCDGLKVGDVVNFTVELVATSCEQNTTQKFKIYPVGLTDGTVITVDLICGCDCEKPDNPQYIINAEKCNRHGTLQCGICVCDHGYFGEFCQCTPNDVMIVNHGCRPENTTLDCSGRGTCICGKCECTPRDNNEVVTGKYCECDNFSCPKKGNLLCSGHGKCGCGTNCKCDYGWTGPDCSCNSLNVTCIAPSPYDTVECSGHGYCSCGKCICDSTDQFRYSGKYCEKCPTCAGRCYEFKDCVQCLMYGTGKLKDVCNEKCEGQFKLSVIDTITYMEEKEEYLCIFYDDDDCKFQFMYYENRTDMYDINGFLIEKQKSIINIVAQKERECPPKVFMLGIVLGVIGAIVLIGLAVLLLWKLLTTIHDRREFARFEKERMMAKWDTGENPIYKQATSTFKNPTYGK